MAPDGLSLFAHQALVARKSYKLAYKDTQTFAATTSGTAKRLRLTVAVTMNFAGYNRLCTMDVA
eukprot:2347183-Amphidinium_carterae.1